MHVEAHFKSSRDPLKYASSEMGGRDELLSIGEVSMRTGLQTSALRYYERSGLIRSRVRIGGRRHYDSTVLDRLAFIGLLQEVGFTIREINRLLGSRAGPERWRALAEGKLAQIDEHLERTKNARALLAAALACQCDGLDRCELVRTRRSTHRTMVRRLTLDAGHTSETHRPRQHDSGAI
jgi:DNA-binding transcriptional MerR regulator